MANVTVPLALGVDEGYTLTIPADLKPAVPRLMGVLGIPVDAEPGWVRA